MKKKKASITLLSALMLIFVNLFTMPAWAEQGDVVIDDTNFPDEIFRSYVSKFDKNNDNILSQSELDVVKGIKVSAKKIKTLKGVEYFKNLISLNCDRNELTTLDVSNNTELQYLVCSTNKLTTLDVSHNTALKRLVCGENALTALDVSRNTALNILSCGINPLTSLDVSHNANMTHLFCSENKLTALDVSQNPKLTIMNCSNNELTTMDVSNNTALESVECSGNRLTNMDLTANSLIQDFNGDEQTYDIAVYNNTMTFDLKSLPGNFDPLKSSEWKGASVEGNTLKLESKKPSEVTYAYEIRPNSKKLLVTLKISYKDKVKIHFDKNGGMGTMSDVTLDKDSSYTLPSCDFTAPKNKEFKAWLAGDEEKNAGDVITVDADTTLKALWKDKEVTPGTNPENPPLNPDTDPNQPGATTHTEGNGNTSKNVEAPKTGDNSALPFSSLLLFVSASGFFALKRKTGKEQ